jgi:hypothetical protein
VSRRTRPKNDLKKIDMDQSVLSSEFIVHNVQLLRVQALSPRCVHPTAYRGWACATMKPRTLNCELFPQVPPGQLNEDRLQARFVDDEIAQTKPFGGVNEFRNEAVSGCGDDAQTFGRRLSAGYAGT